jgi:hypothetical protein
VFDGEALYATFELQGVMARPERLQAFAYALPYRVNHPKEKTKGTFRDLIVDAANALTMIVLF